MMKFLIFDIDGTLLYPGDVSRKALNAAFEEVLGIKEVMKGITTVGRTDPEIIQEAIFNAMKRPCTEDEYELVTNKYINCLSIELKQCRAFHLMPGVKQLLGQLSARSNVALGLATGNLEAAARLKLEQGGIEHYFSFGGFGSDNINRAKIVSSAINMGKRLHQCKDIPNENVFIIGDAPQDIKAGRELKINTIAVCTGKSTRSQLLAENPSYVLPDLNDIQGFVKCVGL